MFNDNKDKDPKDKGGLDRAAFKHAIGFIESRNGKYLDSKHSSAAGKYHFLYNLIKGDPLLKGVSKRDFINDPELQEQIMDKAIDGKLKGYVGYAQHAKNLKAQFDTNLSTTEIAALTHFLGAGGARKYLRDPQAYKVSGVNATPEKYIEILNKQTQEYYKKNPRDPKAGKAVQSGITYTDDAIQAMKVPKDGVNIVQPQIRKDLQNIPQGLQFKENTDIDTSMLPDAVSDAPNDAINDAVIPINEQVQGGTPSNLKVLEDTSSFAEGGSTGGSNEPMVVEFNEGGSHDENPHGGIPIGTGSNGKMNTVEEGETKFGDYVFSDRISLDGTRLDAPKSVNEFEGGGDTDPKKKKETAETPEPKDVQEKKVKEALDFNANWIMDEVTGDRMAKNRGVMDQPFLSREMNAALNASGNKSYREKAVKKMRDTEHKFNVPNKKKTENAFYQPGLNLVSHYQNVRDTDAVHEGIHSTGLDKDADTFIKEKFGSPIENYIQNSGAKNLVDAIVKTEGIKDKGSMFGDAAITGRRNHARYVSNGKEIYPRVMEIRRFLKVKPGEVITDEMIKKAKEESGVDLFDYYSEEKVKDILNTVASNDKPKQQQEYRLA